MTHYCKCLNVNIHLIPEKQVDLRDPESCTLVGNPVLRTVLVNDLEFQQVKVGSSMAGVQSNISLLCTNDTLSYYKSIKQGISLRQCAKELLDYDPQRPQRQQQQQRNHHKNNQTTDDHLTTTDDNTDNNDNNDENDDNDDNDEEEEEEEDPFMNYMVVSCQNCDMTCALYIADMNRYYVNAQMIYGQRVEELKNSDRYSKVFCLLPQAPLDQEQTVNINIDEFPSLRKLQVHMQKSLLAEKVAMEQRIAQFAAEQKQKYAQMFKRTNVERKKIFLRAQHVIKYRRPDIQQKQQQQQQQQKRTTENAVVSPNNDLNIHTPNGELLDEITMFGSTSSCVSDTHHNHSSSQQQLHVGSKDHSSSSGSGGDQKTKSASSSVNDGNDIELSNPLDVTDDGDVGNDGDVNGDDDLDGDVRVSASALRRKQERKKEKQTLKELMSQSYFYRMNNMNNMNKSSNTAVFALDGTDDSDSDSDDSSELSSSESEAEPVKRVEFRAPPDNKAKVVQSSRRALHFQQKLEETPSIYSCSMPIRVPARSLAFEIQQKQLSEKLEEEQTNRPGTTNHHNGTQSNDHNGNDLSSSDSDSEEDEDGDKVQWPIAASLASGRARIGQTFRRRDEDDIFEQPQGSYIDRYMTFRDSFFRNNRSRQEAAAASTEATEDTEDASGDET